MTPLQRRVRRTIRVRQLIGPDDRVAIAVSGGADSLALAWALADLAPRFRYRVAGLIHVDHGLRADDADEDEAFCRELARRLQVRCEVAHVDVRGRMGTERLSLEAAARLARYEAFETLAGTLDATVVATGHTQDDQAETVLLRLFRGAGSRGLSAIRPRRGPYIRPLIDCRRTEILDDLVARGERWREDQSNADLTIPRNYLRREVLPVIVRQWPAAVAALARFAELAGDDERFLAATAEEVLPALTLSGPDGVQVLDVRGLRDLPPALSRRILRFTIEGADGVASFGEIERVRQMVAADKTADGRLDLAGVVVERIGPTLQFRGPEAGRPARREFSYPLAVPGRVQIGETGTVVQASFEKRLSPTPAFGDGKARAVVQASSLTLPLAVRNRRVGDRFRPFGAPGRRKLQDVLVDRKVPRNERDLVPIVVDAAGRIVWVAGLTIAEECRVSAPESGVVILEIKKGTQ